MQHYVNYSRIQQEKKRHPFLTSWLALLTIYSVVATFFYLVGAVDTTSVGSAAAWAIPTITLLLILQTICAVAMILWKKWGFWGYCLINAAGLVVDVFLNQTILWPSITILIGILGLYAALNVGNENKGWPQLE